MSADFVAHMEDVLELYAEPYDAERPVVCFDETSTQLLSDLRPSIPPAPGRPRRENYEYLRGGTRKPGPHLRAPGWRHVAVTERRTMQDFAHQMRWLVDEAYPDVPVVRVVLDNLNTLRMASLYETFPPAEARRITRRLEFHHTPKHGSWLNIACPGVGRGRRSSSAYWPGPASRDGIPMRRCCDRASASMRQSATRRLPPYTGVSPQRTPGPNSADSILTLQL